MAQFNERFDSIKKLYKKGGSLTGVFGALVLIFIASSLISKNFLTGYNLTIMARDLAFIGIVSIGQGLLLLMGDIDLSIGAIAGLSGIVTAKLMVDFGVNPFLAVVIGLLSGALCGAINGFLITGFNLNPLVLTIGTQTAFTGISLVVTKGRTITGLAKSTTILGAGSWLHVPIPVYFLIAVFLIALFLTRSTVFGRNLYAIGNSMETAKIVGIKAKNIRIIAYSITGAFSALAGILMVFRMISAQTTVGQVWVLPSIAAPVIGGIATTGGIGSIGGALIGGAIMGVIGNIIVLGGVNVYWQQVLNGVIVILAITLDALLRRIGKVGRD